MPRPGATGEDPPMRCRHPVRFVLAWIAMAAVPAAIAAEAPLDPAAAKAEPGKSTLWYDARALEVEGKGWTETRAPFDRLPAKAEGVVRKAVWDLSRNSAGLCVRFNTDATDIQARWTVTSKRLDMPHMPASGVSGLDLYVRTDAGKWRWLGAARPAESATTTAKLVTGIPEGRREYRLYLPLYNGVSSLEIGIPRDRALVGPVPAPVERTRPILFYGTSITQGGCASRP